MDLPAVLGREGPVSDPVAQDTGQAALRVSFMALYDRDAETLLRYVRVSTPEPAEAEDICADVFARAWRAWPRFHGEPAQGRAWLLRIARNLVIDSHRRGVRLHPVSLNDATKPEVASKGLDPASRLLLMSALDRLTTTDREVLALRASGLSHAEIAELQQKTENAVKVAWHRAATRLRTLMEEA
jgi:RNA polymerase sigma-70 factor (ECF subfamily)